MATIMTVTTGIRPPELSRRQVADVKRFLQGLRSPEDVARLERVGGAADRRVRLGEVSDSLEAIMFVFAGSDALCYAGAYPPEEARELARTLHLQVNPTNGVTTLVRGTAAERGEILSEDDRAKVADLLGGARGSGASGAGAAGAGAGVPGAGAGAAGAGAGAPGAGAGVSAESAAAAASAEPSADAPAGADELGPADRDTQAAGAGSGAPAVPSEPLEAEPVSERRATAAEAASTASAVSAASEEPTPAATLAEPTSSAADANATASAEPTSSAPGANATASVAPTYARPVDALLAQGLSVEILESELGLPAATTANVALAPDMASVDTYLAKRPQWEQDAVAALLAGARIDEIRDELQLDISGEAAAAPAGAEPDDEAVVAGMKKPAATRQFYVIENVDDDAAMQRALKGSFPKWCVFLHPSQRRSVERNHAGSGRVTGGAGTGKTVVLLHRAARLAKENPAAPILLTTYTKTLASSLAEQMSELAPGYKTGEPWEEGITIRGIDALVNSILKDLQPKEIAAALEKVTGVSGGSAAKAITDHEERRRWRDFIDQFGADLPPHLATDEFFSDEYRMVVIAGGITTEKDYLSVVRYGRQTKLKRKERKAIWRIIEAFHAMGMTERSLPFITLAAVAAAALNARAESGEARPFRHVLVDEAQDFNPGHWLFIRSLVDRDKNDIFLAEDPHQRIYGRRLALSRMGISIVGRASSRLTLNYRTTRETLTYAQHFLHGGEWIGTAGDDDVDSLVGYRSLRGGVKPRIESVQSPHEQREAIAAQIRAWLEADPEAYIGVLTRTNDSASRIARYLESVGIPAEDRQGNTRRRGPSWSARKEPVHVVVWTMHSAKGMEFTHVILADVSATRMTKRNLAMLSAAARKERDLHERALLYVASSRARDELVVFDTGEDSRLRPPSP